MQKPQTNNTMTTNNNNQTETNAPTFTAGQEVWIKAIIDDPEPNIDGDIKFRRRHHWGRVYGFVHPSEIRTSEQILQEHGASVPQNAPDRTRKFKKGDKVRLVERDGRKPQEYKHSGFELNKVYTVATDEDIVNEVFLVDEHNTERFLVSWNFLDLVEPAPKYWVHESPKTYSIYYKGKRGEVITAMLLRKDIYTLEEALEFCNNLNVKDQNND